MEVEKQRDDIAGDWQKRYWTNEKKKKNEKTGLGNENEGGFDKVCVIFLVAFG